MMKKSAFFRDHADTIRQKLNYHLREFFINIANKLCLTLDEVALLTNDEIESHLNEQKQFDKQEIEKRKESFLVTQLAEQVTVLSGDQAKQKARELNLYPKIEKTNKLSGFPASPGRKVGFAKLVYTNKDLKNVKEGDIMVTTMTRQDFVPTMRKIQGLVTQEGGVISHAAIIARELNLPCIVGAKHATSIIKNGDIILIDAEQGSIDILKTTSPSVTKTI